MMWKPPEGAVSDTEDAPAGPAPAASSGQFAQSTADDGELPSRNGRSSALGAQRPSPLKRAQMLFAGTLVLVDVGSTWLAFYLAHRLTRMNLTPRVMELQPDVIVGPFTEFLLLPVFQSILLLAAFLSQRMYQRRRPLGQLDEIFRTVKLTTLCTLLTVALLSLLLRDFAYHRTLLGYAWLLNMLFLTAGRTLHAQIQWNAQARGIGDDRVLLIGGSANGRIDSATNTGQSSLRFQSDRHRGQRPCTLHSQCTGFGKRDRHSRNHRRLCR